MKLGIDIGGSHVSIAVIDSNLKVKQCYKQSILQNTMPKIVKYFESKIDEIIKKYEVTEINISVPGIIKDNKIQKSVNLGIENVDIIKEFRKILEKYNMNHVEMKIRNDAECAAITEHKLGCLKGYRNCVFITLGTGIGSSIIIDNKIQNNAELGHTVIQQNGRKCNCGKNGCFEQYASMLNFKRQCKKYLKLPQNMKPKDIIEYLEVNIEKIEVKEVINKYIKYYSFNF